MKTTLVTSNHRLILEISENTTITMTDKKTKARWSSDPWYHSPGEMVLFTPDGKRNYVDLGLCQNKEIKQNTEGVLITYTGFQSEKGTIEGRLRVQLSLMESGIRISILELRLDDRFWLQQLIYPVRFGWLRSGVETGWLALPVYQGFVIPSHHVTLPAGEFMRYDDIHSTSRAREQRPLYQWGGLSMAWYGVCDEQRGGLITIYETPYDAGCNLLFNCGHGHNRPDDFEGKERILTASPVWNGVDGQLTYQRNVLLKLVPEPGYSALVKEYRRYREKAFETITLKEKAKDFPAIERLRGTSNFSLYGGYPHYEKYDSMWFHFDHLKSYLKSLHDELKIDRCLVLVWGLFEHQPPLDWPIDPRRGGVDKLKECFQLAEEYGYLMTGYHSPSPNIVGTPACRPELLRDPGKGVHLSRWEATCPAFWDELVFEHFDEEQRLLDHKVHFVDIIATGLRECRDRKHPYDKRKYAAELNKIFKKLHEHGMITMTERGFDCLLPHLDYFDGLLYGPLERVSLHMAAFPAPLFNLCYHDTAVVSWHPLADYHYPHIMGGTVEKILTDLIGGNPAKLTTTWQDFAGQKREMAAYHRLLGSWHREVGFEELVVHRFPTADRRLQTSRFGDGSEVWVNFDYAERETDTGKIVPARGFLIQTRGKETSFSLRNTALWELPSVI